MPAVPFVASAPVAHPDQARPLPAVEQQRLDWLRRIAMRSRVMPGDDMFRACAMLTARGSAVAAEHAAMALFRVLPRVMGLTRLRVYEAGALERSFDEEWLMAAMSAADRRDQDSLTFLVSRRLPHHARRQAACLFGILSSALDIRG